MDNPTVFGKIIRRELPADIVYEDEEFIAFKDIRPRSRVHILVCPKEYIPTLADYPDTEEGALKLGKLMLTANRIAKQIGLEGYFLRIHVGEGGGQEVFHVHVHLRSEG
ncbi:MAG TPA: HIT domain-containing protein [Meiothermus sp.]|jgi:histidine triad (HIT) family protein|nr:HIT domain-containing protein [Meiothermus sp.]